MTLACGVDHGVERVVVCSFNTAVARFIGYFPGHLFGRT
jgi:hypothetical protein